MAKLSDFSSLLQLGVGIGIGLSLFRAPLDLRLREVRKRIDAEFTILAGIESEFIRNKRRSLLYVKSEFKTSEELINKEINTYMYFAIYGSMLNLIGLILASIRPDISINIIYNFVMIFISVVWYVTIIIIMEFVSRIRLRSIINKLDLVIDNKNVD